MYLAQVQKYANKNLWTYLQIIIGFTFTLFNIG